MSLSPAHGRDASAAAMICAGVPVLVPGSGARQAAARIAFAQVCCAASHSSARSAPRRISRLFSSTMSGSWSHDVISTLVPVIRLTPIVLTAWDAMT
ncbi:hypothetical protein HUN59_09725 [Curtobacterium sp. Csp2]|uniref:hypothetical protein n=1 Tax=Curtobacterium sp. Csp2 TaxID=2495430 RepID=UPI0015808CD7|nr:hypothetical protein HUN59_09725 [Curtobacterium sp. Csp2]